MSKRTAIIIIIAVLILGTALLYFLLGGKAPSGLPIFTGSPFGTPPEDVTSTPSGSDQPTPTGTDSAGRELPRFVRLSDAPVAGAVGFIKNGSTHVRYIDRATGHVYDVNPSTLEKTKILNITRPKVYEAIFKPDASGYIARTLAEDGETIASTAITIVSPKSTSTEYTVQSAILRGDIDEIKILSSGNLIYSSEGSETVGTSGFLGERAATIFSAPFTQWVIHPLNGGGVVLATKASDAANGYAYRLNTSTGGLSKILGPLLALTVLPSPDGNRYAYTHLAVKGPVMTVMNQNGTSISIRPVTLPEKCVWGERASSVLICGVPESGLDTGIPDNWYMGRTSYSDNVWRFNTDTDTAEILLEPKKNFDTEIDIIDPQLSPDEDYLIFTNKKDLSLWALKLRP